MFRPFERAAMRSLLDKELREALARRGLRERPWAVEVDESAYAFLIEKGFSSELGARPLRRAIERHLLAPLAAAIVEQTIPEGDQFLFVSAPGGEADRGDVRRSGRRRAGVGAVGRAETAELDILALARAGRGDEASVRFGARGDATDRRGRRGARAREVGCARRARRADVLGDARPVRGAREGGVPRPARGGDEDRRAPCAHGWSEARAPAGAGAPISCSCSQAGCTCSTARSPGSRPASRSSCSRCPRVRGRRPSRRSPRPDRGDVPRLGGSGAGCDVERLDVARRPEVLAVSGLGCWRDPRSRGRPARPRARRRGRRGAAGLDRETVRVRSRHASPARRGRDALTRSRARRSRRCARRERRRAPIPHRDLAARPRLRARLPHRAPRQGAAGGFDLC